MTHKPLVAFVAFVAWSFTLAGLEGCYAGSVSPAAPGGGYHWASDAGAGAATGMPCDVSAVLRANCWGCHAGTFSPSLVSYANLTAPSAVDPAQTVLQRSIARIHAASSPMPPPPRAPVSPADVAVLEAWAASGAPMASCDVDGGALPDAGPNPYDTPTVCTSGRTWLFGDWGTWDMQPGAACIQCHSRGGEGPRFEVAGTVYPTAHEPPNCNGANGAAPGGAVVVITDANGSVFRIPTNGVGNFGAGRTGMVMPYTATVEYQGRTRAMIAQQTNGDCNVCHTLAGAYGAPGRIMLP